MRANKPIRFAVTLVALGSAACASSQFDRHFDGRRYTEAAQVFEQDPSLYDNDKSLYRAGVMHALPDSPVFQPDMARNLFARLLDVFPRSAHADEARNMLSLLDELNRIDEGAASRQHELERQITELTSELQQLKHQVTWLEDRFETQESQITDLFRIVSERLAELRQKDEDIRRLREELQRLQEIDINQQQGGTRAPPDTAVTDTTSRPER